MLRLIDAEALAEQHRIAAYENNNSYSFHITAKAYIDNAPTVDAVPVVRCKECKWWRGPIYGNRCSYHSGPNHTEFYDADEFCSRGERKGGDEWWRNTRNGKMAATL